MTDPNQTKLGSSRFPQNHKNSDDGPVYSYNLQHQHFSSEECPGEWRELLDAIASCVLRRLDVLEEVVRLKIDQVRLAPALRGRKVRLKAGDMV